jgi:hypothetical protein
MACPLIQRSGVGMGVVTKRFHYVRLSEDELRAIQYWYAMAAKANYVTGFESDHVDESAMQKIHAALYGDHSDKKAKLDGDEVTIYGDEQ